METKRDKARKLIAEGKTKEAIKIVKTFDQIYTKDELRILQIGYECLTGNENFYKQIGENIEQVKIEAVNLLSKMALKPNCLAQADAGGQKK